MNKMNDCELYDLCKKYGEAALSARRKFAGLLPEVFRRRLYEKKGFSSIFEFAAKLAGMSRDQVSLVFRLEERFADKPVLREALVSGSVSVNKLGRVASIATIENQEELFGVVKSFSNRAVEVFVRDSKRESCGAQNQDSFAKPLFEDKSLHVQAVKAKLNLDKDVEEKLFEMQEKGIDINEFLRNALKRREEEIENKKQEIAKEQGKKDEGSGRYIPVSIKKILKEEYGTKCSYPGCVKEAETLHHTQRFALVGNHDPHFIAPLCSAHHEIAHKIDLKYALAHNLNM